jgi:hypothetical protein
MATKTTDEPLLQGDAWRSHLDALQRKAQVLTLGLTSPSFSLYGVVVLLYLLDTGRDSVVSTACETKATALDTLSRPFR